MTGADWNEDRVIREDGAMSAQILDGKATAAAIKSDLTARVAALKERGVTPGLGTLLSLASLGGIWNGEAVPYSRTTLFAVSSALVLLAVVALVCNGLIAVGIIALRHPARAGKQYAERECASHQIQREGNGDCRKSGR